MYEFIFSKSAKSFLKKLPAGDSERIITTLKRCRVRPHHFVTKLVGSPYFRLRVGNYRLILDIQGDKLIILVLEIGKRKNIYKKL